MLVSGKQTMHTNVNTQIFKLTLAVKILSNVSLQTRNKCILQSEINIVLSNRRRQKKGKKEKTVFIFVLRPARISTLMYCQGS